MHVQTLTMLKDARKRSTARHDPMTQQKAILSARSHGANSYGRSGERRGGGGGGGGGG